MTEKPIDEMSLGELLDRQRERYIDRMTEMIEAIEHGMAKEAAADKAFEEYINGSGDRSRRSLAASWRNRERAADEAVGDAWRAMSELTNLPEEIRQPIYDKGSQLDSYLAGLKEQRELLIAKRVD